MSSETRECANCKAGFVIEPDDFTFYEYVKVPPPTFCPDCRKQRRLSWRNDLNLYSVKCAKCGNNTISIYSPESGLTIYCVKCWWSDGWDPKEYAQEYDWNRPFFEQFRELQQKVPVLATVNDNGISSVNCEYTHDFSFSKNCYMVFIAWKLENCMYILYALKGKQIVDALNSMGECEFTYETVNTEKCYESRHLYYSVAVSNSAFLYDCRDSSNCFMCSGLRHKSYCFKNKQYSKEEYEKILKEYRLDTHSGTERAKKEFFEEIYLKSPRKFATQRNCVNCTGDALINGKNSHYCFNVQRPEESKWIENSDTPKNCYDLSVGGELEYCYEGVTPDHSYQSRFSIFSWKNRDVHYVDGVHSSESVFGSAGLKKGQYCILNKQYSKEEYEAMVPKIIGHMNAMPYKDKNGVEFRYGEFFPAELSYFGYNESVAQDYFPLPKAEAEKRHFKWRENLQMTKGKETMKAHEIPDAIGDVEDSILEQILACGSCGRNYRIVPGELQFYRRFGIPVPRKCFYCRHKARFALRNPFRTWKRNCGCGGKLSENGIYANNAIHFHGENPCPNVFETPFASDRPEAVYCEQCYQTEIA